MNRIEYNCAICDKPGTIQVDTDTPQVWLNKLLPLAACNRCADYKVQSRRIEDRVKACSWLLLNLKYEKPDKANAVRAKVGEKLEVLTKDYARIVCRYHRHGYVWDEEFVAQIMERPERSLQVMGMYEKNVKSRRFA